MLMKLALRNVRRSVRDYAVYFVTLTLGVAVFYAFNAIGDSRVLFEAQEGAENMFLASGASVFDILAQVMTYFSIVVAVVLGFLVLYANRFVVRARKKEFGTYRRGNQRLPPAVQHPLRAADSGLFRAHLRRGCPVQRRADFTLQACHTAFGQLPQ